MTPSPDSTRTLIDELLAEQQQLSVVGLFAQRHGGNPAPMQEKYYRDLIPLSRPAPGQQYAFEVDLDRCSGCKACVSACHSLNGLDDDEAWRNVGLLFSDDWRQPFQQTVTTACHHCADPGCLNGCPVLAYDKDSVTGIVRHLDDQCIGCQYCVMKCPYDVPKYSARRGIVRKCDMCANRLAAGEAPACVQACPTQAIRITLVETEAAPTSSENSFLPASPSPKLTRPTTRYKSKKPLPPNLLAGDHAQVTPAHSHPPLVFMLVLTQLAVGTSLALALTASARWLALIPVLVGSMALSIASLHLGRPLKAWRAFLGWRRSWFSREVIVFGGYIPLAAGCAAATWFEPLAQFRSPLSIGAALTGLLGAVCSAMIYADTGREFWRASQCFGKFLGTMILLGLATVITASTSSAPAGQMFTPPLLALLATVTVAKLAFEHRIFGHLLDEDEAAPRLTALNKTARLLAGELGLIMRLRTACGLIGGVFLPLLLGLNSGAGPVAQAALASSVLLLCLIGELLERHLFFTAVAPIGMPGGIAA